jgi:hypothetical protein
LLPDKTDEKASPSYPVRRPYIQDVTWEALKHFIFAGQKCLYNFPRKVLRARYPHSLTQGFSHCYVCVRYKVKYTMYRKSPVPLKTHKIHRNFKEEFNSRRYII